MMMQIAVGNCVTSNEIFDKISTEIQVTHITLSPLRAQGSILSFFSLLKVSSTYPCDRVNFFRFPHTKAAHRKARLLCTKRTSVRLRTS